MRVPPAPAAAAGTARADFGNAASQKSSQRHGAGDAANLAPTVRSLFRHEKCLLFDAHHHSLPAKKMVHQICQLVINDSLQTIVPNRVIERAKHFTFRLDNWGPRFPPAYTNRCSGLDL